MLLIFSVKIMEDSYLSNIGAEDDAVDLELLDRINQLEIDNEKFKIEIKDLKKENLEQKHTIEDLQIEAVHNSETIKNQNGLIKFYKQYRTEHEDNTEQKRMLEYEEKIKSLEESISIKNKKMEDLNKELQEQSSLNEKLVDVITNKEETIKKLEKGENMGEGGNSDNSKITNLEAEIDNLKD